TSVVPVDLIHAAITSTHSPPGPPTSIVPSTGPVSLPVRTWICAPSWSGRTRAVTDAAPDSPKATEDSAVQSPWSTSVTARFGASGPNSADSTSTGAVAMPLLHPSVSASKVRYG